MVSSEGVPVVERKYEMLPATRSESAGVALYRIRALRDFGNVKAGELGGFIASERNLSHFGHCWIGDDARVYDGAVVSEDARVFGFACIDGHARVGDKAQVLGNARIRENGRVFRNAIVFDDAIVAGHAQVRDNALVFGRAMLSGFVRVLGEAHVSGDARLSGGIVVDSAAKQRRPPDSPGRTRPNGRPPRGPRLRP